MEVFHARRFLPNDGFCSAVAKSILPAFVCLSFAISSPLLAADAAFAAYGRLSQASAGQSYNSSGANASGGSVEESIPSQSYSASAGGSAIDSSARALGSGIWYPSAGASVGGVIRIANPSLLAPLLQPGNSQVQFNLPVSASYNVHSFRIPAICYQAIG